MPGFFQRLANRLLRAGQHTRSLAVTLDALIRQAVERDEQHKELVNIRTPLQEGRSAAFVEFNLLQRSVLGKNQELGRLFQERWSKYIADYMVTASLPKKDGGRDLYLLAAYAAPWQELDIHAVREGIIGGVAVEFHEDLQTAMQHFLR